jgi:hypothetical protein
MPTMRFFTSRADRGDVLLWIFESGLFRVFESYSLPDSELREFQTAGEATAIATKDMFSPGFTCWPSGAGPEPAVRRFSLDPEFCGGATFRYELFGWGAIGLNFGRDSGDTIEPSSIGVNSQKRAAAWEPIVADRDATDAWNWPAVQSCYSKLRYAVSRKIAVDKLWAAPILSDANIRWLAAGKPLPATAALPVAH